MASNILNRNISTSIFGLAILMGGLGNALLGLADDAWHDDIEHALAIAKEEKKDLLLLYTGSDWCPPCKKLHDEVFSHNEFVDEAQQNFVLVEFDFPKNKELPQAIVQQNRTWAEKYGITGYPTVILIDDQQRPYGISGYRAGGFQNYLGILGELHQKRIRRDEAFEKAKTLTGKERAEMLDRAISEMDSDIAELYYDDIIKEIVEIDKEDVSGLRTKWNASKDSELRKIIMTDIVVVSRLENPKTAIQFIDEVLEEIKFPAAQRLQIFQIKLNLLRKLNDVAGIDQLLDLMITMDELTPESKQRLIVKKVFLMMGTDRAEEATKFLDQSLTHAGFHASILWLAKGQILMTQEQFDAAIECLDTGIGKANGDPDLLVELHGAKADCYMSLNDELKAIQTLDAFAENESMPSDLRSEAMLQKAMLMRDSGRARRAKLVENRAIEISESPDQKAEIQKLVERLRNKYGN